MFCRYCGKDLPEGTAFCRFCGKKQENLDEASVGRGAASSVSGGGVSPAAEPQQTIPFYTGKLVIGILSLVATVFILFQSCAAGLYNTMEGTGDLGGTAGFLVVILWLVAGILGIAGRKSRGATMTAGGFYVVASLFAFGNAEVFQDLLVYGAISLIFAVVFIVSAVKLAKKQKKP